MFSSFTPTEAATSRMRAWAFTLSDCASASSSPPPSPGSAGAAGTSVTGAAESSANGAAGASGASGSAAGAPSASASPGSSEASASPGSSASFTENSKVEPRPSSLSHHIVPPISSTTSRAIARPRPVPRVSMRDLSAL